MADVDAVLERLVTDPEFRARLAADPAAALAGYELSPAERELLAAPPDDGRADLPHGVELRTSKSALVGLLAALAPSGGEPLAGAGDAAGRGSGVVPPPAVAGLEAPVPANPAAPPFDAMKETVKNELDSLSE